MDRLRFFLSFWLLFKANILTATSGNNSSSKFSIRPTLPSSASYELANGTSSTPWSEWKESSTVLAAETSLIDSALQFTDKPNDEANQSSFILKTVLHTTIWARTKSLETMNASESQADELQSTEKILPSFSSHLLNKNTSIYNINVTSSTSYYSLTKSSTSNRSVTSLFSSDLVTRSASWNELTAIKPSNFAPYSSSMNFSTRKLSNLHTPSLEEFSQSTQYVSSSQHRSSVFTANMTSMQPKLTKNVSYHHILYSLNKSQSISNAVLPVFASSNSQHNTPSSSSITSFNIHKSSSLFSSPLLALTSSKTLLPFNVISYSKHSQYSSIYSSSSSALSSELSSSLSSSSTMKRESSSTRIIHLYPSRSTTEKSSSLQTSTTLVKKNDKETKLGGRDGASLPVWIAIILTVGAFLVITVISAVAYKYVQWNKDHGDYTLWVSNLELKPVNSRNAEVLT